MDTIQCPLYFVPIPTVKTINKTIVHIRNAGIYFFSIWEKFRQLVLLTTSEID